MKTDFFSFFNHRPEVKLNKRLFVFTICLIIAFISWLQINLSKQHVDILPVRIDFVNLPKSHSGSTQWSDTVSFEVEADGYALFKYKMKDISIDFRRLKKDNNSGDLYFLPGNYTKAVAKQMGDNFKVLRALRDTVQLNFKTNKNL